MRARSWGAGRAPWSPPRRGLDPVTARVRGPPGPGPEAGTELACVHTPLPNLSRPGGRGGAGGRVRGRGTSPVAHRRAQQAGRSLLSKTPGWSCRRRQTAAGGTRSEEISPRPGRFAGAGPPSQLQPLMCPQQRAQGGVKFMKI